MRNTLFYFFILSTFLLSHAQHTEQFISSGLANVLKIDVHNQVLYIMRAGTGNEGFIDHCNLNTSLNVQNLWSGTTVNDIKVVGNDLYYTGQNKVYKFPVNNPSSVVSRSLSGHSFVRVGHNNGKVYVYEPTKDKVMSLNESISGQIFTDIYSLAGVSDFSIVDNHLYMMKNKWMYKINLNASPPVAVDSFNNINQGGVFEVYDGFIFTSKNTVGSPKVLVYKMDGTYFTQLELHTTEAPIKDLVGANGYLYIATNTQIERIKVKPNIGVAENKNIGIDVYPNPTQSIFSIDNGSNEIETVKVYSVEGRLLEEIKNQKDIDLSNYSPGVYSILINNTITKKVVKQ
jgi:hypothetical protein